MRLLSSITIAVCSFLLIALVLNPQAILAQEIIFEVHFDSSFASSENENPVIASGVDFGQGISGSGVAIDSGDILQYPLLNNLNASEGSLSLWVQPNWNPGDILYRILALGKDPRNFAIHVDEGKQLAFAVNTSQIEGKPIKVAFASAENWRANNWYFLVFTWNSDRVVIYINGKKVGEESVGFDIPGTNDNAFHLGSLEGEQSFNGTLDELRVYDKALAPEMVLSQYEGYLKQFPPADDIAVVDIFDRDVTDGISLVDWEGPVRNPAMKYFLKGTDVLEYPLTVNLSSVEERAFFNLPSTISRNGPTKSMVLASPDALESFLFSVYMDENSENESFELVLQYLADGISVRQIIPVTVIDQDFDRPLSYPVMVDFSEARDPLILDPTTQMVITQAATDWLYYVDGTGIDSIDAGESFLYIGGQNHLFEEKRATNPVAYKGYYLYAYGNTQQGPCFCSTGFPNRELLQSSYGEVVPIFRIGGVALNVFGQAFETDPTGWEVLSPYENWTQEGLIGTDMYSLVKHEIGHAMVFENSPLFLLAQGRDPNNPYPDESVAPTPNGFTSPALTAYYPDAVVPLYQNSLSHLYGVLDPASQSTVYGGAIEKAIMPLGREMLTKLDILIMESVGYPLRDNGVTRPLALTIDGSLDGKLNELYELKLQGQGGIPVYYFDISSGVLPQGLELDAKIGTVSGVPEESGTFVLTFRVKDYDERSPGAILETTITIGDQTTATQDISTGLTAGFTIGQNYPNPFQSATIIEFHLPTSAHIELKIFDLLGHEVSTLVQEKKPAGTFQISWDGTNNHGQSVANGVYWYRFAAGNTFVRTRKLIFYKID